MQWKPQEKTWEDFWENEIFPGARNKPQMPQQTRVRQYQLNGLWFKSWCKVKSDAKAQGEPPYSRFEKWIKETMETLRKDLGLYTS